MKHKYPDDGGLKNPVRPFDPYWGFRMIKEHFREEQFKKAQLELDL